jgi:fatty acid desaturase
VLGTPLARQVADLPHRAVMASVAFDQRPVAPASAAQPAALGEAHEATTWARTLSREKRAVIRDLHRLQPAWNLVALFFAAMWAAGAWLVLDRPQWSLLLLGYTAIGVSIHGLVVLMHEGIHGSLFRSKSLDRWFGFLLGIPSVVSFTAYRVTHLAHHRYNRTADDPDEFTNLTHNGRLLALAFYIWMVAGTFVYFFFHVPVTALTRGKPAERRAVLAEYGVLGIIYGAVLWFGWRFGWLDAILQCWLLPMIVAVICGNVRGWAEHMMTIPGHPLTQTRTVTSNRAVSFLTLNLNYHLEHHLFPGMPWYNLPKLHALLQDEYRQAGAFIYKSYLRFLFDAVRAGVHGYAPQRPPEIAPGPTVAAVLSG